MISRQTCIALLATASALLSDPASADALTSALGTRQSLNVTAIIMFLAFVALSLAVTCWAARRGTSTAKDFYAAGAGLAWISNLTSLNFVAQHAAPAWVRARVISMYVFALQGGLAVGSALWGVVALQAGIKPTLTVTAVALCCGLLLGTKFKLGVSTG